MGLNHGFTVSLNLFALVMDNISKDIQDEVPWYMFADHMVFISQKISGSDGTYWSQFEWDCR